MATTRSAPSRVASRIALRRSSSCRRARSGSGCSGLPQAFRQSSRRPCRAIRSSHAARAGALASSSATSQCGCGAYPPAPTSMSVISGAACRSQRQHPVERPVQEGLEHDADPQFGATSPRRPARPSRSWIPARHPAQPPRTTKSRIAASLAESCLGLFGLSRDCENVGTKCADHRCGGTLRAYSAQLSLATAGPWIRPVAHSFRHSAASLPARRQLFGLAPQYI